MSKISSFKRDWDGEPPAPPPTTKVELQTESTELSDTSATSAPKPKGTSRFATIMAALQASGLENKASGKMNPTPEPSSASSISGSASTAGSTWTDSTRATSITSSAQSTSSAPTKRSRDDEAEKSSKKPRGSGDKGVQMSLTVDRKDHMGSAPAGASKANLVITLSYEQTQILKLVQEGKNIFFTGSAGTGKSVLLREIIKALRKKHKNSQDAVAITASTGIAACKIGGQTLHSFSGIGIGEGTPESLATEIERNKDTSSRWLRCKVLIIDEVSMLDGDLFDRLARVACLVKKNPKPFGGIQLVMTGDFFQLSPGMKNGQPKFAFEAEKWSECVERAFSLSKVFRQKNPRFIDILNEMRFGRFTAISIRTCCELARPISDGDIDATELFPRQEDVDNANQTRMAMLSGHEVLFPARDAGTISDPEQRDKMLQNFMVPKDLVLKVDAQVMVVMDIDETLVNGTVGRVLGFFDATEVVIGGEGDPTQFSAAGQVKQKEHPGVLKKYPLVEFRIPGRTRRLLIMPETFKIELPNGEVQVSRTQLPLILSWAMSIHKSQGQTLDRVRVDCGRIFEKGQAYVAFSRATSLEGLQVLNFDPTKVLVHNKVAEWSQTLECITKDDSLQAGSLTYSLL